jgi:hypothetical protein
MEPPITGHDAISRDNRLMHNWRVSQLTRLGLPGPLAEIYAAASTGIMSPGWCSAAARRGSLCASSADASRQGPPP